MSDTKQFECERGFTQDPSLFEAAIMRAEQAEERAERAERQLVAEREKSKHSDARAEHWKRMASESAGSGDRARLERLEAALSNLLQQPVALTDDTGSICAFCSRFTPYDESERHVGNCPVVMAREALKEVQR